MGDTSQLVLGQVKTDEKSNGITAFPALPDTTLDGSLRFGIDFGYLGMSEGENMGSGITLTGDNFEQEVLRSSIPVLIDFWAPWCGPCKMIAPFIDQLAGEYEGKIKIAKVNIDEDSGLAELHGIASVPTFVLYKDGAVVTQKNGAASKRDIEAVFEGLI